MISTYLKDNLPPNLKNIPLLVVLIVPFVLLTTLAVGLTGYLSFYNGRQAVDDVTIQIQNQIAAQIERELGAFLDAPQRINQVNAAAIGQGLLDANDPAALEHYFWRQIQLFESVTSIYFGNPQGGLADAGREGASGPLYVIATDGFSAGPFRKYTVDKRGNRVDLLTTVPNFDARTRPWYARAVERGQPIWSDIYILATGQDLALAASRPVYDSNGELLGVVSNDIFLSHLGKFLQDSTAGYNVEAFIMERSGLLVASSTGRPLFSAAKGGQPPQRLPAAKSNAPLVQAGAAQLATQFGSLAAIESKKYFTFEIDGRRYLAQVVPFDRAPNLDWLVVVLIPEADLTGALQANARYAIWLIAAVLASAIAAGIITARRVSQPLLNLNQAAKRLAAGNWTQPLKFDRIKEINELSRSFNTMAVQLTQSLERMAAEITERKEAKKSLLHEKNFNQAVIDSLPGLFYLFDEEGHFLRWNNNFESVSGYSAAEIARMSPLDFFDKPDKSLIAERIEQTFSTGQATAEANFISKDQTATSYFFTGKLFLLDEKPCLLGMGIDITERKRAEEENRLLLTLTTVLVEAETLDSALALALELVCETVEWDYAEAWLPAPADDHLELASAYYCRIEEMESFRRASAGFEFASNIGLPGRVWTAKKPMWIPDVTTDANFPRATFAKQAGIKSAIGIPVLAGESVVAIMEFFLRETRPEDQRMMTLVSAVAAQLGTAFQRKQAEEVIRQAEARFRNIFQTAGEGICSINEANVITLANPQFAHMVGYSVNELTGESIETLIAQQDIPDFESKLKNRYAGKREVFERFLRRKDGSTILTQVAASPIIDQSGAYKGSFGLFTDITESRRAEEQLRLQATALEAAANAIMITDANGLIEWVNPAFTTLTGYQALEAVGRNPRDLLKSGRHDESFYKNMWNAIIAGRVWRGEVTNRRKDGSLYVEDQTITPVPDAQGRITHFVAIKQDVTERKQAEEQLRDSEARNRAMLQAIPDLMFVHSRDGVYLDYHVPNPDDVFSPPEASLGKSVQDVLPEWLAGPLATLFEQALATGQVQSYEYELPVAGRQRYYEARIAPYGDDKVLRIVREVTERKQLEARLLQVQKMEAIGRLAGGIAHDFNNILVPIIGYAELGMLKLPPEDELYADLKQIKKAADQAAGLTRQILSFSRRQVLEMRVLDINTVIEDFSEMIRRLIGEDIGLEMFLEPALHQVKADQGQIEQALLNLVINARDAMPEGGKLTLETANVYLDEDYVKKYAGTHPLGHYAMLSASDTGHGMDVATKERIFEPFFTTKKEGKGTGLGLATVYGIVKQHGGNIWVYSEPGNGTTFKIYLPQAKDTARAPVTAPVKEVVSMAGTETILVVEDEEMVRQLACETLTARGYEIIEAQDPAEALQLAAEYQKTIHLLLTDVVMPGMNGKALYHKVTALYPNIKVLYMSGYTDNAIVHHGVLDEGVNFLQKPFTVNRLAQKVREVLGIRP